MWFEWKYVCERRQNAIYLKKQNKKQTLQAVEIRKWIRYQDFKNSSKQDKEGSLKIKIHHAKKINKLVHKNP